MGWMERIRQAMTRTSPMTDAQAAKKAWELGIDNGVDFMLGGFGHRAVQKEQAMHAMEKSLLNQGLSQAEVSDRMKQAFPTFWTRAGKSFMAGATGSAKAGGRAGMGIAGWGGRAVQSFVEKAPGRVAGGVRFGAAAAADIKRSSMGLAKIGQLLLTGKGPRTSFGDAFFPYFKTHAATDLAKYSLNPVIGRRLVYAAAPIAVLSGLHEVFKSSAAPPSVYFDGRHMRHMNDMGANAEYGQKILGPNSIMNEDARARVLSQLGHLL